MVEGIVVLFTSEVDKEREHCRNRLRGGNLKVNLLDLEMNREAEARVYRQGKQLCNDVVWSFGEIRRERRVKGKPIRAVLAMFPLDRTSYTESPFISFSMVNSALQCGQFSDILYCFLSFFVLF